MIVSWKRACMFWSQNLDVKFASLHSRQKTSATVSECMTAFSEIFLILRIALCSIRLAFLAISLLRIHNLAVHMAAYAAAGNCYTSIQAGPAAGAATYQFLGHI